METKMKERIIVVQLNSIQEKMQVMKAKGKLTGSKVYVDDDLTQMD